MITVEDIRRMCQEECNKVGIDFKIPVTINGRLTRTLGRVFAVKNSITGRYEAQRMEISRELLETSTEESIRSVVAHECAHYIVYEETGESHGHDEVFKAVCKRLNCKNDKATADVERIVEVKSKYEVWCDNCGKMIGGYSRSCRTIRMLDFCTCGFCGEGNLRLVKNW